MNYVFEIAPAGVPMVIEILPNGCVRPRTDLMSPEDVVRVDEEMVAEEMGFDSEWAVAYQRIVDFPAALLVLSEKMSRGQFVAFMCELSKLLVKSEPSVFIAMESLGSWAKDTYEELLSRCERQAQEILEEERAPLENLSVFEALKRLEPGLIELGYDEEAVISMVRVAAEHGTLWSLQNEIDEERWNEINQMFESLQGTWGMTWGVDAAGALFEPVIDAIITSFYDEDGRFDKERVEEMLDDVRTNDLMPSSSPPWERGEGGEQLLRKVTRAALQVMKETSQGS